MKLHSISALAAVTVLCGGAEVAWSASGFEQRDGWNQTRSEFALTAQAAAKTLGEVACQLPLPETATPPVIDGVLDDTAWAQATECPWPCVCRSSTGPVVASARLLAVRSGGRVFLALRLPTRIGAGPLLTVDATAVSKALTVCLTADGTVAEQTGGAGSAILKAAKAHAGEALVVECELALPEGEIVVRPDAESLGLRAPHPWAALKVRLLPERFACRLSPADGLAGRRAWRLTVSREALPAAALAAEFTACRGFGEPVVSGKAEVSAVAGDRQTTFTLHTPVLPGSQLLRLAVRPTTTVEIREGWRRWDTPTREADPQFAAPEFDDRQWGATRLPDQDDPNWPLQRPWLHYRVRFQLPADWRAQRSRLLVNKIDDHGWVYVNGKFVGEHHRYDVPFRADVSSVLRPGENVLAILVKNDGLAGGLVGRVAVESFVVEPFSLACAAWLPDNERLLERTQTLLTDRDISVVPAARKQLDELAVRTAGLRPGLGSLSQLAEWDEVQRQLWSLRRTLLLSSPLLDGQPLVFVKRPNFGGWDGFFGYTSYVKRSPAELCVLESLRDGGPVRSLLRTESGCVRDPDVSFDGRRVLFAYARDAKDTYHLYEIQGDGAGLRQLTTSPPYSGSEPAPRAAGFQDVEPCYLPSGEIVFTSTRYVRYVDCVGQGEPVTTLFAMAGDGSQLRGISANHVHDWHPSVLNDGRILYTRWEYTDRSQMWSHKLFVKNPDGARTAAYYGSNSWWPVSMLHARAIPGSEQVLCTLTGHHSGTEQAGEIARLDRARGTEETGGVVALFPPRPITAIYQDDPRPGNAVYSEPYPLSEQFFLVGGRPPGCERFGLYLADFRGNLALVYEDDALDCLSPMPLVPRSLPPAIAPLADYRGADATVLLIDVYRGEGMRGVSRGTVKALRVVDFQVRDTPETGGLRQENGPSGGHSCPVTALGGSWHVKRILGTVPVYEDGSALFRIPAERRVFLQPLDERGQAVQSMRSWIEAAPGERLSCVGCHERGSESPHGPPPLALAKGPVVPTPWYGPPRDFGFVREVQPVLDKYCVRCHDQRDPRGTDLRGSATNWFSLAYENLRPWVKPIGPQGEAGLVPPRSQGAVASPLVQLLQKGHEQVQLDAESLDRIITWIDLNVPYYDNSAVTRPAGAFGNASGRALVTNAQPLWDALGQRCAACHKHGFQLDPTTPPCQVADLPRTMTRPCVNFTQPEQSRLLLAPLSPSAGGLGLCGEVFRTRTDPVYQNALAVIQAWHQDLVAHPREDLPGFVPCAGYTDTLAKRAAWLSLEAQNRQLLPRP